MEEEWRPVSGYEGTYEVSSLGRVRSIPRITRLGGKKAHIWRRTAGRILYIDTRRDLYARVYLSKNGVEKYHRVHCLVAEAFLGPRPSGYRDTNHMDHNKLNNVASNLEYLAQADNLRAAHKFHGTKPPLKKGAAVGTSKLTEETVRLILSSSEPNRILANRFNVCIEHIWSIRKRRCWKHLHGSPNNA